MVAVCGAFAVPAGAAGNRRTPTLAPNDTVIAGPSTGIMELDGISIARDGTGGVVFLANVGGVAHVFVSRLSGGDFQAPVQIDAGLVGPSSQPVIAAGQGGVLLVGFIDGGQLYVASAAGGAAPISTPVAIAGGAINPSISMSNFGKAYLAFTVADGSGYDVRSAFYYQGRWALEPTPLNVTAADDAGLGPADRPDVAASGDGVGIVVWGEGGHVYARRVVATTPSVAYEQADVATLDGWQEMSAGDPVVATGGDSSYASVGFQEQISSGASQQSRVLLNRLHGSQFDGIFEGDGVTTGGPEGADQPQTAVTEYGAGWVTSEHDQTHQLYATTLANGMSARSTARVDSLTNSAKPDATPAIAGLFSTLIAWQQTPGVTGPAEIRFRYAPNGNDLGPEQIASSPTLGPTNADSGLVATGDVAGDAAIAWVQGTGASTRIVAAQLFQAPGSFSATHSFAYVRTVRPTLSWSAAAELWGSPTYTVNVDGAAVAQTQALAYVPPAPLAQGRHSYQITAANQAAASTPAGPATVFVDTIPPIVSVAIIGKLYVHRTVHLTVSATDAPPGVITRAQASGIATIDVRFGDGSRFFVNRGKYHAYARTGRYTVTVVVTDRAGNRTTVRDRIRITNKPKPKRKRKKKHAPKLQAAPGVGG